MIVFGGDCDGGVGVVSDVQYSPGASWRSVGGVWEDDCGGVMTGR